jgi:hypothetical protein
MNAEPEVITVRRFRCPFCRRSHSSKTRAVLHIGRCWYNPAVRCCKTCANFVPDQSEPGYVAPEYCDAGVDISGDVTTEDAPSPGPITGCPLWALKTEEPAA